MRKYMVYLLLGFVIMFLITYIGGVYDDAFKKTYYTGVWYKDILASLKYYILWVVPYWWLIILVGTIVIGSILYGVNKLLR